MGKGEIAHYEQFLLFPQCFQKVCFPEASKDVIVWEWVKMLQMMCFRVNFTTQFRLLTTPGKALEKTVGYGENDCNQHFLIFEQWFLFYQRKISSFYQFYGCKVLQFWKFCHLVKGLSRDLHTSVYPKQNSKYLLFGLQVLSFMYLDLTHTIKIQIVIHVYYTSRFHLV